MKLGRNDRCSCGSGKKFKNCCEEKSNSLELGNLVTDFLYNYYIISRVLINQNHPVFI